MTSGTEDHDAFLVSWLIHEKKLITYRLLSRELRIHVTEAKEALAKFYDSHKDKSDVAATFILIGAPVAAQEVEQDPSQPSSSTSSLTRPSLLNSIVSCRQTHADAPRQMIKLVTAVKLQDAKASFSNITSCHVYSLSPGKLRDATQLAAVQHDLHSKQKYVDAWQETDRGVQLGVIASPDIQDNFDPSKSLPSLAAPSAPALAKKTAEQQSDQRKKDATKQEKTERATKAAEVKSEAESNSNAGKNSALDWSRSKTKAEEPASTKSNKNGTATKATKKSASARKALLGSDDDEEDEKDVQTIDNDDDEEDEKPEKLGYADDSAVTTKSSTASGKRADAKSMSKAERESQQKELMAMMDEDDATEADPDVPAAAEPVTAMMQGTDTAAKPRTVKRVRKKRKIGTKRVRSKDERGYTVTTMEDEYESYSSDESDSPIVTGSKRAATTKAVRTTQESPANKEAKSTSTSASASPAPQAIAPKVAAPAPPKKPPASSGPPKKGQQNLNSFFTRKTKDK